MPCSACGGGGSSASSQFSLGRRGFKPLQARQPPKMIYVTPARSSSSSCILCSDCSSSRKKDVAICLIYN